MKRKNLFIIVFCLVSIVGRAQAHYGIGVNTQRFDFVEPHGTEYIPSAMLEISNLASTNPMPFSMRVNEGWMFVHPTNDTTGEWPVYGTLEFRPGYLPVGVHTGNVWISAPLASNSPIQIDVVLEITPKRGVPLMTPEQLITSVPLATTNAEALLSLFNEGTGTVSYALETSQDWIGLDGLSNTLESGETRLHTLTFSLRPDQVPDTLYGYVSYSDDDGNYRQLYIELTVLPAPASLAFAPTAISNEVDLGKTASPQPVEIWNAGGGTLHYSLSSTERWLTITPASNSVAVGSTNAHNLVFDSKKLSPGEYTAWMLGYDRGAKNPWPVAKIPVTLTVIGSAPLLDFTVDAAEVEAFDGGDEPIGKAVVLNRGNASMNYSLSAPDGHVMFDSASGSILAGKMASHPFSIALDGLAPGCHTLRMVAFAASSDPSSVTQTVSLCVNPDLGAEPSLIETSVAEGETAPGQSLQLWNAGSTHAVPFRVEADADWLTISPTSGVLTASTQTLSVAFASGSLAEGVRKARVRVVPQVPGMNPEKGALSIPVALAITPQDARFEEAIVFASNRGGDFDIWMIQPDGSGLRSLVSKPGDQAEPRVSPDGTLLAYYDGAADRLVVLNLLDNSEKQYPPLKNVHWREDSSGWIGASRSDCANQIVFQPLDGKAQRWLASRDHLQAFGFDETAAQLYFTTDPCWLPNTMVRRMTVGGPTETIIGANARAQADGRLSPQYDFLYNALADNLKMAVWRVERVGLANPALSMPFDRPANASDRWPDPSPDGQRVVFTRHFGATNTALIVATSKGGDAVAVLQDAYTNKQPDWNRLFKRPIPQPGIYPASFAQTVVERDPATWEWTLFVSNRVEGSMSFTIENDAPWLTATNLLGTTTGNVAQIAFEGCAGHLAAGVYTGRITVTIIGATNQPPVVEALLTVQARPSVLALADTAFELSAVQGTNAAIKTIFAFNSGGGAISLTTSVNQAWLNVTPTFADNITTQGCVLDIECDPFGLAPGMHEGTITVTAPGALESPQIITARMEVIEAPPPADPFMEIAPTNVLFNQVHRTRDASNQTFFVRNGGGGALLYKVASAPEWLTVQPASLYHRYRLNQGAPDEIALHYRTHGLPEGVHTGRIAFVTGQGTTDVTVVMTVLPRPRYPVNYSAFPANGGAVYPSVLAGDDGLYEEGTRLRLTAQPAEYFTFQSWGQDAAGNEPVWDFFVMGTNTIRANFRQETMLHVLVTNRVTGTPIANARVQNNGKSYYTDASGVALFRVVNSGVNQVRVSQQGYGPRTLQRLVAANQVTYMGVGLAPVFLSNLRVRQQPYSTVMELLYDLDCPNDVFHGRIEFDVSINNGQHWQRPLQEPGVVMVPSGDIAFNVRRGANRRIEWNARTIYPGAYYPDAIFRLRGDGAEVTARASISTIGGSGWRLRVWADRNGNDRYDPGEEIPQADVYFGGGEPSNHVGRTIADGTIRLIRRVQPGSVIFARKAIYHEPAVKAGHHAVSNRIYTLWMDSDVGGTDGPDWDGNWRRRTITAEEMELIQQGRIVDVRLNHPIFEWHFTVACETTNSNFLAGLADGFYRASENFYRMTDGQMKFGMISITSGIAQGSQRWRNADVVVFNRHGYRPRATLNGMWRTDEGDARGHINMGVSRSFGGNRGPRTTPFITQITHEHGHYGLGLHDEYISGTRVDGEWTTHRASRTNTIPWNYGMMDDDTIATDFSSFNDYLAAYPANVRASNVTAQTWFNALGPLDAFGNTNAVRTWLPCWQMIERDFARTYNGIPAPIFVPPAGVFRDGRSTSEDRPGSGTLYFIADRTVSQRVILPPYENATVFGYPDYRITTNTRPADVLGRRRAAPATPLVLVTLDGEPVANVSLVRRPLGENRMRHLGRTDATGTITLLDVQPGDLIEASRDGYTVSRELTESDFGTAPIEIKLDTQLRRRSSGGLGILLHGSLALDPVSGPVWQPTLHASAALSGEPELTLSLNDTNEMAVIFHEVATGIHTATVALADASGASAQLVARSASGDITSLDALTLTYLDAGVADYLGSPDGWLQLALQPGFIASNTAVLIYQGGYPVPGAPAELTTPRQVGSSFSIYFVDGHINPGLDYAFNLYYQPDAAERILVETLGLYQWNQAATNWTAIPASYDIEHGAVGAALTNGGIFTLFAEASSDDIPPGTITNLLALPGDAPGEILLAWTATGDDGEVGTATFYQVRSSEIPILTQEDWDQADAIPLDLVPQISGADETATLRGLEQDILRYYSIRAVDASVNIGPLGNTTAARTPFRDDNHNGIPDQWEDAVNAGRAAPMTADDDGFTNFQEYTADTDPLDEASFLHIKNFETTPDGIALYLDASTARVFSVQSSTNILDGVWQTVDGPHPGQGQNTRREIPSIHPVEFFNIEAEVP